MLVTDAIRQIKAATHDTLDEYSEQRCLDYLNEALQQAAGLLMTYNYYPLVKEITLKDGMYLPHNFMKSCGNYPMKTTGNRVTILDGNSVKFRYYAVPENITSEDYELPFHNNALNQAIVRMAIMIALNENEFDIQQDATILQQLQNAIAGGMGVGANA